MIRLKNTSSPERRNIRHAADKARKGNAMINVLVTGASGFAGGVLAGKLIEQGCRVRALVRNPSKLKASIDKDMDVVVGDITDQTAVSKAVEGVETVYHIAALFRQAGVPDSVYRDVNVKGTEYLLEASKKAGVKRFVHCSTVGVHGDVGEKPVDENCRFAPGDIYQETKLEGERLALRFYQTNGFPVSIVRPGPIYGPGDLRLLKLFKLAAKKVTPILGNGSIKFNMVFVEDLADAFILAGKEEKAVGEVFIAAGPDNPSLNEIVDMIAEILDRPKNKIHIPAKPFQVIGFLCEKVCIPLKIEPPIYRRRVDFFTKSRAFDISKAKKILGYRPKIHIRDGLERTIKWYLEKGLLQGN